MNAVVKENHRAILQLIKSIELESLQKNFDASLTKQTKFYRNYMKLFETLLLFIRASREQSWNLHLQSLHLLCPYFFAFDMLNYARMTPVYLSQMYRLEEQDPETWNMFNMGNFSVNKSRIPFTAIGADHGIEQENRALKVAGGIKGIANSSQTLNEYFLTAAEMGNIINNFCECFGIEENQSRKRDEHHQLSGSKNKRIANNCDKLTSVFEEYDITFDAQDSVYNVFTKKVFPQENASRFLQAREIGQARYDTFVKENMDSDKSIWDTIKKEKLSTFVSNNKSVTVTVDNQVIKIKEERKFMNRLLVASRTRPDIDLPKYLGEYEFSVTPSSLFAPDGILLLTKDKSVVAKELRNFQTETEAQELTEDTSHETRRVIVIDGMAIVNKIDIKKNNINNCLDFAFSFVHLVEREVSQFDEVRVIFDRYDEDSLKSTTRDSRTKNYSAVHYKISDSTRIGHLKTKQFLASIDTKNELTEYLSKKLEEHLSVDYVIVYQQTVLTNLTDFDQHLRSYCHEEADTGIVLHALDVSKRNPFTDMVISCSDTDVLLILLNYFEDLTSSTIFKTIGFCLQSSRDSRKYTKLNLQSPSRFSRPYRL